ncbi:hypothetical protein BD777DRAFT_14788 [Yarrowia lipolytica]|nr:hypothetical protein BD777DRAFT_14788 [Yarrowia lipolytica]
MGNPTARRPVTPLLLTSTAVTRMPSVSVTRSRLPSLPLAPSRRKSESSEITEPVPMAALPPPDVGLEAWLACLEAFCDIYASFGYLNVVGLFETFYLSNQPSNYSASTFHRSPPCKLPSDDRRSAVSLPSDRDPDTLPACKPVSLFSES